MDKDHRDFVDGDQGNAFARGWGQVSSENHARREADKRAKLARAAQDANSASRRRAAQPATSSRRTMLSLSVLAFFVTLYNPWGLFSASAQGWGLGISAISFFVAYKFWNAFKAVLTVLIVLFFAALFFG